MYERSLGAMREHLLLRSGRDGLAFFGELDGNGNQVPLPVHCDLGCESNLKSTWSARTGTRLRVCIVLWLVESAPPNHGPLTGAQNGPPGLLRPRCVRFDPAPTPLSALAGQGRPAAVRAGRACPGPCPHAHAQARARARATQQTVTLVCNS